MTRSRLVAAVAARGGAGGRARLHLGRPAHAWKALRNLRRSWLSREVALFGGLRRARRGRGPCRRGRHVPVTRGRRRGRHLRQRHASTSCPAGRPGTRRSPSCASSPPRSAVGPLLTGHRPVGGARRSRCRLRRPPRPTSCASASPAAHAARAARSASSLRLVPHRADRGPCVGIFGAVVAAGAGLVAAWRCPLDGSLQPSCSAATCFYVTVVPLDMPGSFSSRDDAPVSTPAIDRLTQPGRTARDRARPRPRRRATTRTSRTTGSGPTSAKRATRRTGCARPAGTARSGCGMLLGVRDGRAVAVQGDPDHPVNRGRLCPKGLSEHHTIARRRPADQAPLATSGGRARATGTTALDHIADALHATASSEHGPGVGRRAVAPASS